MLLNLTSRFSLKRNSLFMQKFLQDCNMLKVLEKQKPFAINENEDT